MRQTTFPEQTAKLIELGVDKPCSIASVEPIYGMGGISVAKAYSIGELFEQLPKALAPMSDPDNEMMLNVSTDSLMWAVRYGEGEFPLYETIS